MTISRELDAPDSSLAGVGDASVTACGESGCAQSGTYDEVEPGDVLAGRYQIEAAVGRGGSGRVFRAWDRVVETAVAVKLLDASLARDPVWVERVGRELKVARRIQHPNICRVYEVGCADGRQFLTMELASGGSLRATLGEPSRPLAERMADARGSIGGLAALHDAQVVHRDVKPENLLRMEDGRLALSDFGLATLSLSTSTRGVGTPSYMAPELAMGQAADFRSDVWALGIVLHEVLFGRRPEWRGASPGRELVPPAAARASRLERSLFHIVAACLAETPARRPASAAEVRRLFGRVERGKSVSFWGVRRPRQLGWALLTAGVAVSFFALRNHLWAPAAATSSARPMPTFSGEPADWSKTSRVVGTRAGRVHCMATLPDGRLRVVWGSPRVAEDIDPATLVSSQSPLRPETFADSCPQLSPDGSGLLFVHSEGSGPSQIMYSTRADGGGAVPVVSGSDPVWLPSGGEFVFRLDLAHAALFSLSVMRMQLMETGLGGDFLSLHSAVSPTGELVSQFLTTPARLRLTSAVLWQLPSLREIARFDLPMAVWHPLFVRGDELVFWGREEGGRELLFKLDWRTMRGVRLGTMAGADVGRIALDGSGRHLAFVKQEMVSDIYRTVGGRDERLTSDGRSYAPSLGKRGDLLLQLRDERNDSVIAYRAPGQPSRILTAGPMDVTPSFASDGQHWVYSSVGRSAVMLCDIGTGSCRELHRDDLEPVWPRLSSGGETLAYIGMAASPRLRVVPVAGGNIRDLGPARAECPLYWTSGRNLWAMQGPDGAREWVEFDTVAGRPTGNRSSAGRGDELDPGCQPPAAVGSTYGVREIRGCRSELRVVSTSL